MSKGSTKVKAPDPYEVAQADAQYNRINQYTPYGNLEFFGPERNQSQLTLNPAVQGLANRQIASDQMLLDMALGRQSQMAGGSLPSLTTGLDLSGQQELFGVPRSFQQGFDAPNVAPQVPDYIGDFQGQTGPASQQQGMKGGAPNQAQVKGGAPQAVSPQAGQPGSMNGVKGGTQPMQNAMPQQGAKGGAPAQGNMGGAPQQQGQKGGGPQGGKGGAPQQPQASAPQSAPQAQGDNLFGGTIGELIDPDTFGQLGDLNQLQDFDLDRGRVEQSYFDRTSSLLNPQFQQDQEELFQNLANRGIPRDSEAGRRELANFQRGRDETYSRLANDAVLQGGGEQSRLFGMAGALGDRSAGATSSLFGMGQQLVNQDIQSQLQQANIQQANRATQFNELASLLGLQQVAQPGLQNFFAPANADVTGAFALNQQGQMANANNATQLKGGALDALGGLGIAKIGA